MKVFLILLLSTRYEALPLNTSITNAFDISNDLWNNSGWFVPNNKFNSTWVTKDSVLDEFFSLLNKSGLVKYFLFTKLNPNTSQELEMNNTNSLASSNFNGRHPTKFLIHGFQGSHDSQVCTLVRDAFLKRGSFNIICVDWNPIAVKTYPTARFSVGFVGNAVANFANFLIENGDMSLQYLTVVGHSLGAHVAGFTAKNLKVNLHLLVALDPALPLFSYKDCSSRVCKTDAQFVESIQTCGGRLGFSAPIGKLVYYPNGGVQQPGCGLDVLGSCAHARSVIYFAEAISKDDFPTIKCKSYIAATLGNCGMSYSDVRMGTTSSYGKNGIYYVPVNSEPLYGKGTPLIN